MTRTFTATIWREDGEFVAVCPELDVAPARVVPSKRRVGTLR